MTAPTHMLGTPGTAYDVNTPGGLVSLVAGEDGIVTVSTDDEAAAARVVGLTPLPEPDAPAPPRLPAPRKGRRTTAQED